MALYSGKQIVYAKYLAEGYFYKASVIESKRLKGRYVYDVLFTSDKMRQNDTKEEDILLSREQADAQNSVRERRESPVQKPKQKQTTIASFFNDPLSAELGPRKRGRFDVANMDLGESQDFGTGDEYGSMCEFSLILSGEDSISDSQDPFANSPRTSNSNNNNTNEPAFLVLEDEERSDDQMNVEQQLRPTRNDIPQARRISNIFALDNDEAPQQSAAPLSNSKWAQKYWKWEEDISKFRCILVVCFIKLTCVLRSLM